MFGEPARVLSAEFPENKRILTVSDIHGNLPYFLGALRKAEYNPEKDILVVNGDFLEKGNKCLETLRFLMKLKERENVFLTLGNCDGWHLIFQIGAAGDEHHQMYLQRKRCGFLWELLSSLEYQPDEVRLSEHLSELKDAYGKEFQFLASLPHAIETEQFVFVHAGRDASKPLREHTARECNNRIKFLLEDQYFDKWTIVGHHPSVLYRRDLVDANPIIDREKKIVSIDGGCVLKDDGQLNVLIIPNKRSDEFSFVSYDDLPEAIALENQEAGEKSFYICWGDNDVELLSRGDEFSHCRHIRTGYEMDILTKYLFSPEVFTKVNDCTDYVLPIHAGDHIKIKEKTSRGYLAKHNGISGWYFGKIKPIE